MQIIHDKHSLNANLDKIEPCRAMYISAFPIIDEREDFDLILQRIETKTFQDDAKTFLLLEVNGGMVVEYYPSAKSLLITYIFVDETHRHKGIGAELLIKGLQNVKSKIAENLNKPCFAKVFLEVHSPEKTNEDSIIAALRYEFFKKNGAKKIDIPYVQPSLGEGKNRVKDLDFLTIPNNGESLQKNQIYSFLYSFYKELGIDDPEQDNDFRKMNLSNTNEEEILSELEYYAYDNKHEFHHCSVAMHFPFNAANEPAESCKTFASFEQDLKSFWYQKNKTICSHVTDLQENTQITFPESINFISEGRKERILFKEKDSLSCNISASITTIRKEYSVITIIIQPAQDTFFNEFDLIRLCSLFGSKQEQAFPANSISFGNVPFKEFVINTIKKIYLKNNTKNDTRNISESELYDSLENISGTVVLNIEEEDSYNNFFDLFHKLELKRADTIKEAEEVFGSSNNKDNRLLCAFLLGIFDFNRLNKEEISDTLIPVNTGKDSLMFVNRGCLLVLRRNDDIYFNLKKSIGINPYYILPFIVVTYNEFLIFKAEKSLQNLNRLTRKKQEKAILQARKYLLDIVDGVFEYLSEKKLLEYVENERHSKQMQSSVNQKINLALEDLEFRRKRILMFFEGLIGYILLVFGITQGSAALLGLMPDCGFTKDQNTKNIIILSLILASTIFFVVKTNLSIKNLITGKRRRDN